MSKKIEAAYASVAKAEARLSDAYESENEARIAKAEANLSDAVARLEKAS
jgi:hypothetical protein